MTLKVLYVVSGGRIVQWQNTDMFNYPEDPEGMASIEVTPEQFENPIYGSVVSGVLSEDEPVEVPIPPDPVQLALAARNNRESLLRSIYDPGILMAQRALRLASTPEEISYAEGKIAELDTYAEDLVAIPDQAGFPLVIIWPVAPTK